MPAFSGPLRVSDGLGFVIVPGLWIHHRQKKQGLVEFG